MAMIRSQISISSKRANKQTSIQAPRKYQYPCHHLESIVRLVVCGGVCAIGVRWVAPSSTAETHSHTDARACQTNQTQCVHERSKSKPFSWKRRFFFDTKPRITFAMVVVVAAEGIDYQLSELERDMEI